MPRYDRQYDFGLRGYPQTTRPMMDDRFRGPRYHPGYDRGFDERAYPEHRLSNRVTARYNRDYVVGYQGNDRYDQNYQMYTGDYPERMGDGRWMRKPYWTVGGSRTMRGASFPTGYDYPMYGPNYGGRYPDEL